MFTWHAVDWHGYQTSFRNLPQVSQDPGSSTAAGAVKPPKARTVCPLDDNFQGTTVAEHGVQVQLCSLCVARAMLL